MLNKTHMHIGEKHGIPTITIRIPHPTGEPGKPNIASTIQQVEFAGPYHEDSFEVTLQTFRKYHSGATRDSYESFSIERMQAEEIIKLFQKKWEPKK